MVKRLLGMGADPNFINERYNAASIAHMNGHRPMFRPSLGLKTTAQL